MLKLNHFNFLFYFYFLTLAGCMSMCVCASSQHHSLYVFRFLSHCLFISFAFVRSLIQPLFAHFGSNVFSIHKVFLLFILMLKYILTTLNILKHQFSFELRTSAQSNKKNHLFVGRAWKVTMAPSLSAIPFQIFKN